MLRELPHEHQQKKDESRSLGRGRPTRSGIVKGEIAKAGDSSKVALELE